MIIVFDQDGSHNQILDKLINPLGIPYKIISKFDETLVIDAKATTIIIYLTAPIDDDLKDFLLLDSRTYHLIIFMDKDIQLDDFVKFSSENIVLKTKDLDEMRRVLRLAMTDSKVRRLRNINASTIFLAKNGLYPGIIYHTEPSKTKLFLSLLFSSNVDKSKILVVSRNNFRMEIPEVLDIENFIWVTDSIGAGRNRPANLSFIMETINKKITDDDINLIFVDIFDLLMIYHSFFEVARAFEQLKSSVIERNIYLIMVLDKDAMEKIQYGMITRFSETWQNESAKDLDSS
ncbi:MAG: DUF835 domain-containing protein [Thermoplasmataceae archaeon]